jgi:methionyl aminopeptidase
MAKRPLRRLPPIHDTANIAQSREAGMLAARVLEMLTPHVQPGVSTEHLDQLCHDFIVHELKCIAANIGYHGFPKTVCTSVNHVVCHGIPTPKEILKDGDIVNVDVALIKDGWFGDTSRMYTVGNVAPKAQKLIDTTYEVSAPSSPARRWATLATPSRPWPSAMAFPWCVTTAAMASVRPTTTNPRCCTTATPVKA